MSTSSSPAAELTLVRVPLDQLHPHPLNPNVMSEERLETLERNIEQEERYPPLVARPHPDRPGEWQLLDGHQRVDVLRRLGHQEAVVYPWPCDDETALLLLATLNRLEGEDVPARRAELLASLSELRPAEELALLLPESAEAISDIQAMLELDVDTLLGELGAAANAGSRSETRAFTVAVSPDDEAIIEGAIEAASADIGGRNRRGRALALICGAYLEAARD